MVNSNWSKALGLILCFLLAACGGTAPTEPQSEKDLGIDAEGQATVPIMGPQKRILAFGDSLFAGYGVGAENSYPVKLQNALRARGINAQVANAGVSGDTTAAGLQRFAFTLDAQEETPDLVIVELGGNDLLRGLSPDQTRANLDAILQELGKRKIPALLMGMRAPPNYGPEFQQAFDAIYPDLAAKHGVALVPFFQESIYDKPEQIQQDRIHPTEIGIEVLVGATVEDVEEALE